MWRLAFLSALALLSAGCAEFAKTDHRAVRQAQPPEPPPFSQQEMDALYYYDLGPDHIDVSGYPKTYREGYAIFTQTCSKCHTLSRAINSPRESYIAWKFYVFEMRMASNLRTATYFDKEQAQSIVDFLTYDSMYRKDMHRKEFEENDLKLRKRFAEIMSERLHRLQETIPIRRRAR